MKDARWLWIDEQQCGPFSVDQLYRMARSKEVGPSTLFWSENRQQWLSLTSIMFDIEPEVFQQMHECGITSVEILDSGTGEDCPTCHALTGRTYPIATVLTLPPDGCTCVPWCRCTFIAVPDED